MKNQALALLAIFVIITLGLCCPHSLQGYLPGCLIKNWIGLDCPGCGLTRSFIFMSQGNWTQAFQANWAGPFIYAYLALFFVEKLLGLIKKGFQLKLPFIVSKGLTVIIGGLFFGHWVIRFANDLNTIFMVD